MVQVDGLISLRKYAERLFFYVAVLVAVLCLKLLFPLFLFGLRAFSCNSCRVGSARPFSLHASNRLPTLPGFELLLETGHGVSLVEWLNCLLLCRKAWCGLRRAASSLCICDFQKGRKGRKAGGCRLV